MSGNFPGHYTPITSPAHSYKTSSNLINMSPKTETLNEQEFDNADVPLSSTLCVSPNSRFYRSSRTNLLDEESNDHESRIGEPKTTQEATPTPPPRTPTPVYLHHPRYFYDDGSVFILIEDCLLRLHAYHFLVDRANIIAEKLKELGSSDRHPITLPKEVRLSSFEHLLSVIYRRTLDSDPIHIKTLKDACLTAHSLGLTSICNSIAKHIMHTDCPDESLDDAVPKYTLAIKLPDLFAKKFKDTQVDKLCCAAAYMSHSHFYELGFTELGKVWKAALTARAGYDAFTQKTEIYEPPAEQARASYLLKVKNVAGYRAVKKELFG